MWVARDKYNHLWFFVKYKPVRTHNFWECPVRNCDNFQIEEGYLLNDDSFQQLKWEDEPLEVCLCVNDEKYHTVKAEDLDKLWASYAEYKLLKENIENFNKLPWYKRIFKKI